MKLVSMTCPHCGAALKVDSELLECTCEYCDSKLILDHETVHVKYDNAEESGYQFEKGRQRAKKELEQERMTGYIPPRPPAQEKKKKHGCLWILGWICIFPVPLTILLLRNDKMKSSVKYGIIAAAWIIYLLIGATGNNDTSKSSADAVRETMTVEANETVKESETNIETASAAIAENLEYDSLQKIFLTITKDTTEDDVLELIDKYDLEYTAQEYNGSPKELTYKLAYEEGVALQKYADSGDSLEISFSKDDGALMLAEYFNEKVFKNALYYNYGTHWDFHETEKNSKYAGYYYHKPGENQGGIMMGKKETGYFNVESAENALMNILE